MMSPKSPSLHYLETKFRFKKCQLSEDHTVRRKIEKNLDVPPVEYLKENLMEACELVIKICKLIRYKKNLNLPIEFRYILFKRKANEDFGESYIKNVKILTHYFRNTYNMSEDEANDFASNSIIQSLYKIELYDEEVGEYMNWLYTIAKNLYFGEYEKHSKYMSVSINQNISKDTDNESYIGEIIAQTTENPNLEQMRSEKTEILLRCIDEMHGVKRKVIYLRTVRSYQYEEIREAFSDISPDIVSEVIDGYNKEMSSQEIIDYIKNEKSFLIITGDEFHMDKRVDMEKVTEIINKYEELNSQVIADIIENYLKKGQRYQMYHCSFDMVQDTMKYWKETYKIPKGYSYVYEKLSSDELNNLSLEYYKKHQSTFSDLVKFIVYDKLSYSLSTVKSQIKSAMPEFYERVSEKQEELEYIDDIYYHPFEQQNTFI